MRNWLIMLLAIVLSILFQPTAGEDSEKLTHKSLTIAFTEKPPYTASYSNGSLDSSDIGIIRDAILRYIRVECGRDVRIVYHMNASKHESEFGMIELLRQNKVHIASPIFVSTIKRKYSEFTFFKLDDYPGSDYIITENETDALRVVLAAVKASWPLFAVTLVLTAIAGVIMWALDTYWNREEFPRSFIKGSWDGFWWSFVSMTTVGYGDKAPKSIVARIFSVIWIQLGLIIMAIFMAHITSALTAYSLEVGPSSLSKLKVAVLGNGTEYQHALQEGAHPIVFDTIDKIVQAVKSDGVRGMLLDRYRTSHYQTYGKLTSLITVKKFEFRREVGILLSKDRQKLAKCLNIHRSEIWRLVQTMTDTFKQTQQTPAKDVNLFGESSPFVTQFLYISLGVLCCLLLTGVLWDIFIRKKAKPKQNVVLIGIEAVNERISPETDASQNDLEVTRSLLRQLQEQFNKLEASLQISRSQFNDSHEESKTD